MTGLVATAGVKSRKLSATVSRCGCSAPATHNGLPCPTPKRTEKLGVIAYWHRNPVIRFLYKIGLWRP